MNELHGVGWILICAALVFVMQAGFICLESGLVRSKNSINVAIKKTMDICLSGAVFWTIGYGIMYGESYQGIVGTSKFFFDDIGSPWLASFFIFQVMFCSTTTTIVSGVVAERMRFWAYLMIAVIVSGFVYPVAGHWIWGGAGGGETLGWLANLGFIDFAGSTVVHSVGGWIALAAAIVVGPRIGRFGKGGCVIRGNNIPIAALGTLLLWFGWFGFNGGSTFELNEHVPGILINTCISAMFGGLFCMLVSNWVKGQLDALTAMNGIIAGLVSITASCHIVVPSSAAIIGAVAGGIAVFGIRILERMEIDDAVGAIPAHLFAGIWGTLAVALFAEHQYLAEGVGRWQQFQVQSTGVVCVSIYAFGLSLVLLRIINNYYPLRINVAGEIQGLNISEHGETTEILDLLVEMEEQTAKGDFTKKVNEESTGEVGQIARQYNNVLNRVNQEIRGRQNALDALFQSEARKSAIMEAALDAIITINYQGDIIEFNAAAEKTFGYSRSSIIGLKVSNVILQKERREEFEQMLALGFTGGDKWVLDRRVSATLIRIHDTEFPAELAITDTKRKAVSEYTLHLRDITQQRRIQNRLQHLARNDHLTGLSNRGYFLEKLQYFLKHMQEPGGEIGLMFLDLDGFKVINDTLGHAAGDYLLKIVSDRLREQIREEDLLARWGGDEFILALIGSANTDVLESKATALLTAVKTPLTLAGNEVSVSVSIGIAQYPACGSTAGDLVRCGDLAMFRAKKNGRNNFQFFTLDMEKKANERFNYKNDLRRALSNEEFFLEYQPQIDVNTGLICGVEALVRWLHPERGRVAPIEFIPIMENTGMIVDLGEWVLKQACQQNRLWQSLGCPPMRIAVNLSGRHFLQKNFSVYVSAILNETGLAAEYLELEITETVLAEDTEQCVKVMDELKEFGVKLSVDDFGTGYSSLSYLKSFPIDLLKIDRSFVDQCDINSEDGALCSAIIALAKNLRLKTIAEGVETPEQLRFLQSYGCDYYQGYLFSKPVCADDISKLLFGKVNNLVAETKTNDETSLR